MEVTSYPSKIVDSGNNSPNSAWSNLDWALRSDGKYAKCNVTSREGKRPKPSMLVATGFKWDIGQNTKVKEIKVEWRDYKSKDSTDVNDGIDSVNISIPEHDLSAKCEGVGKYGVNHEVTFDAKNLHFGDFGNISVTVDYSSNSSKYDSFEVLIEYIRVTLIFDQVYYILSNGNTEGVPTVECTAGKIVENTVYFRNGSGVEDDAQEIIFEIPDGVELYGYELEKGTFNEDTLTWTVDPPAMIPVYQNPDGKGDYNVMQIKMRYCVTRLGVFTVKAKHKTAGEVPFYINCVPSSVQSSQYTVLMDYDDMFEVSQPTTAKLTIYDFKSQREHLQYWFNQSGDELADCDFKYELVESECTKNVESIDFTSSGSTGGLFTVNLDEDSETDGFIVVINLTFTYITTDDSVNQFTVRPYDSTVPEYFYYLICDKRGVELIFEPASYEFTGRGILFPTEDGGYVLPAIGAMTGTYFELIEKSLYGHIEEPFRHIGNVILPVGHYEPKFSYKNTLTESSYKNRRYMGKKGNWDESLSLNLTLPKYTWASLKGIVQMDKPVYINTSPYSSDDDLLNHRGWAVVSEITDLEQRNPFQYEGSLTVDYLTHEYSPLLSIELGNRVCEINPPSSLINILDAKDPLDGLFSFGGSGYYTQENGVNKLTADLGRDISLTNKWVLTDTCEYIFDWTSILPDAYNDPYYYNTIEFRVLKADTGKILLKYTYYNFEHKNEEHEVSNECNVSGILYDESKSYSVVNEHIHLDYDSENPLRYGSKIHFKLDNGLLTIIDEGINGSQVVVENIELEGGEYKLQGIFSNRDVGLSDPEFINILNVTAYEDTITGRYNNFYRDLIVSPMPLPMNLVFYRVTATGTLYYYTGEMRNATYFSDPFNQYKGGVNLETLNGVNVISTDTNSNPLFLQNGLIRAGFDRNFGSVQIQVYNKETAKWEFTQSLKVKNFNDFSILSYSDDMISIGFGETTWTLWRGRPYLQVEHPNDDLIILNNYDTITCEKLVDSDGYIHHDGNMEDIYLYRLRTFIQLFSEKKEYYYGEPIELIACVTDSYGEQVSRDVNDESLGEVDFYIDGEFHDTVLEPYKPYNWTELQQHINDTPNGGTLILDDNYEYDEEKDTALVNGVTVDHDLTIVCEGYDFCCDSQALIFDVLPNCELIVQEGCFSEGKINSGEHEDILVFPNEDTDGTTELDDKFYYATVQGKLQLINMKIQVSENEFILDYTGSVEGQQSIDVDTTLKAGD